VDQAQIPTYLALVMNAIAMLLTVASFFRRYVTKDDIKWLGNVEDRLGNVANRLGNVENRQAALEDRIDSLDGAIRENGRKVDSSLDLYHTVRGDLKVLTASVNRIEGFFETPKLKSS